MPVKSFWDNEDHTIVRMEFVGRWTWDEVHDAFDELNQLIESVDYVVDGIIDLRQSVGVPPSALTHARNLMKQRHDRTGINVIVGASPAISTLWQAFSQAYFWVTRDDRFTFAKTLEEGRRRIAVKRQSAV